MPSLIDTLWHALEAAGEMAWEVWWALVVGFLCSAIVQAWVPRERITAALAGDGPAPALRATALGAASSSCSYAALAIAKSLFQKGASATSALAFQLASTNLVLELGLVLWVLIGWQFALAEYLGGIVMVALIVLLLRLFVSRRLESEAREYALHADTGHQHHASETRMGLRARLTSVSAWSDVAHNFRGDWQMLYREIGVGFLLAGLAAQVHADVLRRLFFESTPAPGRTVIDAVIGPLIAVLSCVCSIGNVPLAAVLWSGGIGFAGVLAFIFADLIALPMLAIYRRYYGGRYAVRIVALMFVAMVAAALVVDLVFGGLGLVPSGARPSRSELFKAVTVGATSAVDLIALLVFAALIGLTVRRGAKDPICGMTVDRRTALRLDAESGPVYFCSAHCLQRFEA